jgi:hypothetical protein
MCTFHANVVRRIDTSKAHRGSMYAAKVEA